MKAVVAAFSQEKALVGAFSVITNLRIELFQALACSLLLDPRGRVRPVAGREVVVVEHVVPQDIVLLLQFVHLLLHTVLQPSMLYLNTRAGNAGPRRFHNYFAKLAFKLVSIEM